MSIVLELRLAARLAARIDELMTEAKSRLPDGLEYRQYDQACGMIEGYRQVKEVLIPELIEEIQKE